MSIFSEDFQSYAVGALAPFGSVVPNGFATASIIDDPVGAYGDPKSVIIPGISSKIQYTSLGYHAAVSVFFTAYFIDWGDNVAQFWSDGFSFGSLFRNDDGTISIRQDNANKATSTKPLKLYNWNFFQCNFVYTDVAGFVHIDAEIAVNGESIVTASFATTVSVGALVGLGANLFQFGSRYDFGRLTIDTLQAIGSDPNPGVPDVRHTQESIEISELPDDANINVTQGNVEIGELPDDANMRVTQGVIELVIAPDDLTIACPVDHDLTTNVPVSIPVVHSGGFGTLVFAITAGALPTGLTLDTATGVISGTPTLAGTFSYTVSVTDDLPFTVSANCSFQVTSVAPPPPTLCAERFGPKIYFWEPSFLERPEDTVLRATDWDDCGYKGLKFIQGFKITADTENTNQQFKVQGDQADVETFTISHNGQLTKAYSLSQPVQKHLVRILPIFTNALWRLFEPIEWIYEPAPEFVTEWKTQGTDHDLPGYNFLKDIYIAHASTADITLNITVDGTVFSYTIPNSGGVYKKTYLLLALATSGQAPKGKLFTYELTSSQGFQLYQKDCEVRVHAWAGGEYMVKLPFGDLSRTRGGARI